jgi:hypothetical protein
MIDVGVTGYSQGAQPDERWPARGELDITEMASNKFLLLPEGNDVASASSWSLLASSVVLMVYPPEHESMVLHGLLKPWVHYIPVKPDFSDLEEQMQWCISNVDDCEDIVHRASMYMYAMYPGSDLSMQVMQGVVDTYLSRYKAVVDCYCNMD